jgi:hypothetical protein
MRATFLGDAYQFTIEDSDGFVSSSSYSPLIIPCPTWNFPISALAIQGVSNLRYIEFNLTFHLPSDEFSIIDSGCSDNFCGMVDLETVGNAISDDVTSEIDMGAHI